MPERKPMSEWKHGTHGTYVNGCRCDPCRLAATTYKRELYHRNLAESRRKCREKMRGYARARSIGDFDQALIARDSQYRRAVAEATGELAALVVEQAREDVRWIKPDLRFVSNYDLERRYADDYADGDMNP